MLLAGQEFLDEDIQNPQITSWSGSQTSSQVSSPGSQNRDMLEDDKEFFYNNGKSGGQPKKTAFEFKLDDDITKEFRNQLPEK